MTGSARETGNRAKSMRRGVQIAQADLRDSGGAFGLEEVIERLNGVSPQMVEHRVREGSLLAVEGPGNRRVYPAVQFESDGSVVAGLEAVRAALPTDNPWSMLNFLIRPEALLDGRVPIDLLRAGQIEPVVSAARRMGHPGG